VYTNSQIPGRILQEVQEGSGLEIAHI